MFLFLVSDFKSSWQILKILIKVNIHIADIVKTLQTSGLDMKQFKNSQLFRFSYMEFE